MVEKEKCKMIIAIVEKSKLGIKCQRYWPKNFLELPDYKLKTISVGSTKIFKYKKIEVLNKKTRIKFEVEHFHIHDWKDHGTLNSKFYKKYANFLAFIISKQESFNFPIIAHCSAGIGRSGTFVASFYLFQHFLQCKKKRVPFKFSIFDIVHKMREQRHKAV